MAGKSSKSIAKRIDFSSTEFPMECEVNGIATKDQVEQNVEQHKSKAIKPHLSVEVIKKANSRISNDVVIDWVKKHLKKMGDFNVYCECMPISFHMVKELNDNVNGISIYNDDESKRVSFKKSTVDYHCYALVEDGPEVETLDESSDMAAAHHWLLPSSEFHGLWENLIYDCNIKNHLLNFAATTLLFSDKKIDANIISWNRVVLLHGPPGTGKTTLCKALAQKLCIRLGSRYSYGQLIEINSHSLFSKWFSESGKLVSKMFEKIHELSSDSKALVFVLIDEIESLAHVRKAAGNGNEPSDAIRVVNAVLTQIDAIKRYPNVLILTTSNITGAIDLALIDRADIKQYIGLPLVKAIMRIYESCIIELQRTGILHHESNGMQSNELNNSSSFSQLHEIATKSVGLSGRALRKLPFLAHALYIQEPTCTLQEFMTALSAAVTKQFQDTEELMQSQKPDC